MASAPGSPGRGIGTMTGPGDDVRHTAGRRRLPSTSLGQTSQTVLDELRHPIVLAPLAGGASTPALTAAVSEAGGFGFLAGGYLTSEALEARIEEVRDRTPAPYGVNLFVPGDP